MPHDNENAKGISGFNLQNDPPPGSNREAGKSYLLAIGINKYQNHPHLNNAVEDAKALVEVLTGRYEFLPEDETRRQSEAEKQAVADLAAKQAAAEKQHKEEDLRKQKEDEARRLREAEDARKQREAAILKQQQEDARLRREAEERKRQEQAKTPLAVMTNGGSGFNWRLVAGVAGALVAFLIWGIDWGGGGEKQSGAQLRVDPFENEMLPVQGGTFQMGSNDEDAGSDEKPVHTVTLSDFLMSKNEVTFSQFQQFIEATGYQTDADKEGWSYAWDGDSWEQMKGVNWKCNAEGKIRPTEEYSHPVIHVSWNDATAFCDWLKKGTGKTYRLPTEAEWEYAAGNGKAHTKYSWGNGAPSGKKGGNVADETFKKKFKDRSIFEGYTDGYIFTAPVGQFDPNEFGLFDMTGNVWEWCSDWKGDYPSGSVTDPKGLSTGSYRVIRGGSWYSDPQDCRAADRDGGAPGGRSFVVGFRLARTS